jgi:hypothetical protein
LDVTPRLRLYLVTLLAFGASLFEQVHAEIACPDDRALELLRMAKDWSTVGHSYVIEQATRPMDEPALRSACFRFAYDRYREADSTNPEFRFDTVQFNAAIPDLKARFPLLRRCPEKAIYRDPWLPTVRVWVEPSATTVDRELTGWVEFELTIDERGSVESVLVIESSDKNLETASTDAVANFKYGPQLNEEFKPVRVSGVRATVHTTYFDLARVSGCVWEDP